MPGLWERFNDVPGGDGLSYYLGPAARPISALAGLIPSMAPGADTVDMQVNSARLMDYQGPVETLGDAGWLGLSTLGMALPGRPGALREPVEQAAQGIRAYHGSPHDFDRFSMDKIGTGEGAQAYGHGLYFAESEGVAKSYRDALVPARPPGDYVLTMVEAMKRKGVKDIAAGVRRIIPKATDDEITAAIQRSERSPGHMYEVNINASPDDFLDWDKPLSEQSEKVRGALADKWLAHPVDHARQTGRETYMSLPSEYVATAEQARERATAALREAGIPGIRYLDAGSRTAGDGSRNYVVFDDKLIDIVKKYGFGGLLAGSGLALSAQEHQGGEY